MTQRGWTSEMLKNVMEGEERRGPGAGRRMDKEVDYSALFLSSVTLGSVV